MDAAVHATPRPRRTALRAAWLLDTSAGRLVPEPTVLIEGGRIVGVDSAVAPPPDAEITDLPGVTLLPGLIDTHVHLAFDASTTPVVNLAARTDAEVTEAMAAAARTALLGGVTTVRDLGDRNYLSLSLRGRDDLPTILAAGPPITRPDGHCHYLGGCVEPGPDGMRAAIRDRVERGVDVVKIMGSGGALTPSTQQHLSQFERAELRAAVEEAHRHGLPVTVHAHAVQAIVDALAVGADGMEHVTFWTEDGIDAPVDVLDEIVERQVVVGATVGLLPQSGDAGPPPQVRARLGRILANMTRLVADGARVVAGTDAGIAPAKPHDVLRYAPAMLASIGLTNDDILRTITVTAAEVCGLGDTKGRLAPGYDGDVLAVDGDPRRDLGALHRIRAVYARGVRMR